MKPHDWFTVGEGDKLLVLTLLPMPIAQTTPSILQVLGQTISYIRMSFNNKQTGKTMTQIFEQAKNEDDTKCTFQNTNYFIINSKKQMHVCEVK